MISYLEVGVGIVGRLIRHDSFIQLEFIATSGSSKNPRKKVKVRNRYNQLSYPSYHTESDKTQESQAVGPFPGCMEQTRQYKKKDKHEARITKKDQQKKHPVSSKTERSVEKY